MSIQAGRTWQREVGMAEGGGRRFSVRKQREVITRAQLVVSFLLNPGPQPVLHGTTTVRVGPTSVNQV